MSQTGDIKLKIRDLLQELVDSGDLGEVVVLRKPESIFKIDINSFPAAIMTPSSFSGIRETNKDDEITHNFEILIVEKADNIDTDTYLEDLAETIRKKFANKATLDGLSLAVEPVSSAPEPISEADYNLVIFFINLKVRVFESLIT